MPALGLTSTSYPGHLHTDAYDGHYYRTHGAGAYGAGAAGTAGAYHQTYNPLTGYYEYDHGGGGGAGGLYDQYGYQQNLLRHRGGFASDQHLDYYGGYGGAAAVGGRRSGYGGLGAARGYGLSSYAGGVPDVAIDRATTLNDSMYLDHELRRMKQDYYQNPYDSYQR